MSPLIDDSLSVCVWGESRASWGFSLPPFHHLSDPLTSTVLVLSLQSAAASPYASSTWLQAVVATKHNVPLHSLPHRPGLTNRWKNTLCVHAVTNGHYPNPGFHREKAARQVCAYLSTPLTFTRVCATAGHQGPE